MGKNLAFSRMYAPALAKRLDTPSSNKWGASKQRTERAYIKTTWNIANLSLVLFAKIGFYAMYLLATLWLLFNVISGLLRANEIPFTLYPSWWKRLVSDCSFLIELVILTSSGGTANLFHSTGLYQQVLPDAARYACMLPICSALAKSELEGGLKSFRSPKGNPCACHLRSYFPRPRFRLAPRELPPEPPPLTEAPPPPCAEFPMSMPSSRSMRPSSSLPSSPSPSAS